MTRPLRIQFPGAFFHITSRGNRRRTIFLDDLDHEVFLRQLKRSVVRFKWKCISYCLMGNHYHLLLQLTDANLSPGMRDVNGIYAQSFNARHEDVGSLFQPRFRGQLVQDEDYLRAAARYIALNPVRAGLTRRPEDWRWSSYAALQADDEPDFIDTRPLLNVMDADPHRARYAFGELVQGANVLPAYDPRARIFGDADFVRRHAPDDPPAAPVERRAWEMARPELDALVGTMPTDDLIRYARRELCYTQLEIAEAVGCSVETVRRRLKMTGVRT
jgi:putative transposase